MNANELADELDHVYELTNISECKSGGDMLRQQQAEIDALKKELYFKNYYEELPDTPVGLLENFKPVWQEKPELTLTDEEIGSLIPNIFYMDDSYSKNLYDDAMKFARAILRKAQEKC